MDSAGQDPGWGVQDYVRLAQLEAKILDHASGAVAAGFSFTPVTVEDSYSEIDRIIV